LLPVARSGKVKKGQKVNIYLANYPDEEFGIVKGMVEDISLVPVNDHYTLEIALPDGLLTTYKKTLPFSQEMTANAEIITEDMRLIERFVLPLKKLWKERLY
jgi:HlyD family secretion protein